MYLYFPTDHLSAIMLIILQRNTNFIQKLFEVRGPKGVIFYGTSNINVSGKLPKIKSEIYHYRIKRSVLK